MAIKELSQLLSPGSGSTKRLRQFRAKLARDVDNYIFDDRVRDVLVEYEKQEGFVHKVNVYLDSVKDESNRHFTQSRIDAAELDHRIQEYALPNHADFRWNRNYQTAKSIVKDEFSNAHLKSSQYKSDQEALGSLSKTDTLSGFSYLETGKNKKFEYEDGLLSNLLMYEEAAKADGHWNRPILPFGKPEGGGAFDDEDGSVTNTCQSKTRLISVEDIYQVISESRFGNPVMEFMSMNQNYVVGKSATQLLRSMSTSRAKFSYWMSLDYSHFDSGVNDWEMYDAFDCLHAAFAGDPFFDEELWNVMVRSFVVKTFVTSTGVVKSNKGVASGSKFTNVIDSIVNRIRILTYLISKGIVGQTYIQGDDNLVWTNVELQVEDIASYVLHNFGAVIHIDSKLKSGNRFESPWFLSRRWDLDGTWRAPEILISKMLFPRYKRQYDKEGIDPALIIYGFILEYPKGMSQFLDIDRFYQDHDFSRQELLNAAYAGMLSGSVAYNMIYNKANLLCA